MRCFKTTMLILLYIFFISSTYKILCLLAILYVWRTAIKEYGKRKNWSLTIRNHSLAIRPYQICLIPLFVCLFLSLPRFRNNSNDRIQLLYQNEKMDVVSPPLSHYVLNAVFPEQEICNICCALTSLSSPFLELGIGKYFPIGGTLLSQYADDNGIWQAMVKPYRQIENSFEHPMSGIYSQAFNQFGFHHTQAVYIIKPKGYNRKQTYPLVVFCHGYLGNWLNYTGILKRLDNCVVICVGTRDLSGIFTVSDINNVFKKQIPFIERLGYKIDWNQIHLMGLSNGGSAANVAYSHFSSQFKSVTFISCEAYNSNRVKCLVNLCGGRLDTSSLGQPSVAKRMERNRNNVGILWKGDYNHYMMVRHQDEFIDFISKRMK